MNGNYEKMKQRLLDRQKELEELLKGLTQEKVSDTEVQDPGDQAAAATSEDIMISIQANEYEELRMIAKALKAIENGTYGACQDCGNPIAEKRLLLYPNATRCITCQEASEER
jgi:DnaK suppressor protein